MLPPPDFPRSSDFQSNERAARKCLQDTFPTALKETARDSMTKISAMGMKIEFRADINNLHDEVKMGHAFLP
jgi:hypothetical protein